MYKTLSILLSAACVYGHVQQDDNVSVYNLSSAPMSVAYLTTATTNNTNFIANKTRHVRQTDSCGEIPDWLTQPKTGQKAWDKCIEYQEKYVFPCEKVSLAKPAKRSNYCKNDPSVTNNIDFADNYYNYVVSLGEGVEENLTWGCNGVIISESHVLTSPFCTLGFNVSFVYLGAAVPSDNVDPSRLYRVKKVIKHPDSNKKNRQNYINILETEEFYSIKLNHNIRPACLHSGEPLEYQEATLISRDYDYNTRQPGLVQKVKLKKDGSCAMCYEEKSGGKPSRNDNGGPLQVRSEKINCMEVVIGIKVNKISSAVHMFNKIYSHLSWIESVVWP